MDATKLDLATELARIDRAIAEAETRQARGRRLAPWMIVTALLSFSCGMATGVAMVFRMAQATACF